MPRASNWVRERRAARHTPSQPAPIAMATTPAVSAGSWRLSPREHLYASVGDEGLVGRYGARVTGELLLAVQDFEEATKQRCAPEAKERAYYVAWTRAEVARGTVLSQADAHGPLSQTVAFLLGELDRLNARWQRGLELDGKGWDTSEAEEKAFQTFRAIAAEAEEIWSFLEALAPECLQCRYFLEPVENEDTDAA